jgi:hypothetical protein
MRGGDCTYARLALPAVVFLLAVAACGGDGEPKRDLRIERPTAQGYDLLHAIVDGLTAEMGGEDLPDEEDVLADASPGQRAIYALTAADGEVNNGGFEQFFFNSSGAFMHEAIDGAELIGAPQHAEILGEAAAIYPEGTVPKDRAERDRILQSVPEVELERVLGPLNDRWYAADRALERKMVAYVEENPDEFFR